MEVVARNVKEQVCEVWRTRLSERLDHSPFDLARTLSRTDVQLRRLWVGDAYIELGWERYLPAEGLFDNEYVYSAESGDVGGIQDMVRRCIRTVVAIEIGTGGGVGAEARRRELRDALLTRVVLSGGTAMMPGFSERLKFELERTLEPAPNGVKPPVVVSSGSRWSAWIAIRRYGEARRPSPGLQALWTAEACTRRWDS